MTSTKRTTVNSAKWLEAEKMWNRDETVAQIAAFVGVSKVSVYAYAHRHWSKRARHATGRRPGPQGPRRRPAVDALPAPLPHVAARKGAPLPTGYVCTVCHAHTGPKTCNVCGAPTVPLSGGVK